ncbi:MAG: transporter [Sphingomicrobium sp.]
MDALARLAIALSGLAVAMPVGAGTIDEPICADRPGKGSATCTVPKGHWQIETGLADWSLTKARGERSTEFKLGETAIKYGVGDRTHIEVSFTPLVRNTSRTATARSIDSGFGDVNLKVKQELTGDGAALAVSLYPYVIIPTASKSIGNGKVEGGLIVPLSLSFGKSPLSLSAAPELDASLDGDGHGYHPYMAQSLSFDVQATEALSMSAELWGSWDWDPAGTTREATVDGSFAYKIGSEWQLDGGANFGLNRSTADVEIYGGVSVRF